jgi:ABC-type microcin C transport system permease subunit YejB
MAAFLLRRLVLTIPVVWIVVTLVFALIHIVPAIPWRKCLGRVRRSRKSRSYGMS